MNRRRNEPVRNHFSIFLSLIVGAIIAASGGVMYAYYMNRQVETKREIGRVEGRIKERQLEIVNTEMRIGEVLNRYVIREQLAHHQSSLKPIARGVVEDVRPTQARTVAYAVP